MSAQARLSSLRTHSISASPTVASLALLAGLLLAGLDWDIRAIGEHGRSNAEPRVQQQKPSQPRVTQGPCRGEMTTTTSQSFLSRREGVGGTGVEWNGVGIAWESNGNRMGIEKKWNADRMDMETQVRSRRVMCLEVVRGWGK